MSPRCLDSRPPAHPSTGWPRRRDASCHRTRQGRRVEEKAVSSYWPTAFPLPTHGPLTAHSMPTHGSPTAHSLPTHCPLTAHSLPTHGPLTAHPPPLNAHSLPTHGPLTAHPPPAQCSLTAHSLPYSRPTHCPLTAYPLHTRGSLAAVDRSLEYAAAVEHREPLAKFVHAHPKLAAARRAHPPPWVAHLSRA